MLISEKCDKIMELIPDMGCKQCVILGIMGMARTIGLVKHISAHKQFKKMSDFDIYIHGGIKKVLYNDLDINKKIKKGIKICNSLISALEQYDYSDISDNQDSCLMDTAYRLVERWFYFIDGLSYDFNDNKCKRIARYSTIPGSMIYTYLCVLYHVENLSDKRAEEHPIYKKELNIIDNDMRFVQEDHNNSEIEQKVKGYMEYKFWE